MKMLGTPFFIINKIPVETKDLKSLIWEFFMNSSELRKIKRIIKKTKYENLKKLYEILLDFHGNRAQKCLFQIELLKTEMEEALP